VTDYAVNRTCGASELNVFVEALARARELPKSLKPFSTFGQVAFGDFVRYAYRDG